MAVVLLVNGLLGRLMLEHWWPEGALPDSEVVPSPYVEAIWG